MDALSRFEIGGDDSIDINDDLSFAIIDLFKDEKEATRASPYTLHHLCDHE